MKNCVNDGHVHASFCRLVYFQGMLSREIVELTWNRSILPKACFLWRRHFEKFTQFHPISKTKSLRRQRKKYCVFAHYPLCANFLNSKLISTFWLFNTIRVELACLVSFIVVIQPLHLLKLIKSCLLVTKL